MLLSTHQTEDVAALCERVLVMIGGRIRFDGAPAEFAELARGKVWLSTERTPGASLAWRTGEGRFRNIGQQAPRKARLVEPTMEDAYLLLAGEQALRGVA